MNIRSRTIKKIIIFSFVTVLFAVACAIGLSYYIIISFTKRPIYSSERLQEHIRNRALLFEKFGAQSTNFTTQDGITLSGLLIVRQNAQRAILLCHGYRMSKERMLEFVHMFPHDTLLMFDYRAHGQSEGAYTTIGFDETKDVLAALNVLKTNEATRHLPIIGIGVSMGAVSLLGAAAQQPLFKGLILDSPFARLDKQAQKTLIDRYKLPHYPFDSIGSVVFQYLMQFSLADVNALVWAEHITVPVLIIHSERDDVAAFQDAIHVYENIKTDKQLWAVATSGHARIINDCSHEYQQKVHSFIQSMCI